MKAKITVKAKSKPESSASEEPAAPVHLNLSKEAKHNRESYLERAVDGFAEWFLAQGKTDLPPVRVACGFPGGRGSKKILGACWDANSAKDKKANIFISPLVDDTALVLHVLCHELVHACVGHDEGHGPGFKRLANLVGLRGKATATYASPALLEFINGELIPAIGKYPHAKLSLTDSPTKKQTTRMIKCVCKKSGYTCRTTRAWLDKHGPPISPVTKKKMSVEYTDVEDGEADKKQQNAEAAK